MIYKTRAITFAVWAVTFLGPLSVAAQTETLDACKLYKSQVEASIELIKLMNDVAARIAAVSMLEVLDEREPDARFVEMTEVLRTAVDQELEATMSTLRGDGGFCIELLNSKDE